MTTRRTEHAEAAIEWLRVSMPKMTPEHEETIAAICEAAARSQQLAVHACNRSLTKREEQEDAALDARLRELVAKMPKVRDEKTGKLASVRLKLGGDPRGAVVKLVMPDGRYDSWGGKEDGYCVPTPNY